MIRRITAVSVLFALLLSVNSYCAVAVPPQSADISFKLPYSDGIKIDGSLGEDEHTALDITEAQLSFLTGSEEDLLRAKQLSFSAYASYDDEYIYLAVKYAPDGNMYRTTAPAATMWQQTCLMISAGRGGDTGRGYEAGYRLRRDGVKEAYVFNSISNSSYSPLGEDFAITYTDGTLIYEVRVPHASYGGQTGELSPLALTFCISDGDYYDNSRYLYVQLGRGIVGFASEASGGKDISLFPVFELIEHQAPPTADTFVVLLAAAASAGVTVLYLRRKDIPCLK